MSEHVPRIVVLLPPACAHAEEAVFLAKSIVAELNVEAEIHEIMVETEEKDRELRFLGSPSIRLDGREIEPGAMDRRR
jgi:hypothetical protein